mgnify:CR=1 FL=1
MEVQAADPNRMTESLSCLTEMCGIGVDKEAVIPYTIKTEGIGKGEEREEVAYACFTEKEGQSAESPPKERICEVRPGAGSVKRE